MGKYKVFAPGEGPLMTMGSMEDFTRTQKPENLREYEREQSLRECLY